MEAAVQSPQFRIRKPSPKFLDTEQAFGYHYY